MRRLEIAFVFLVLTSCGRETTSTPDALAPPDDVDGTVDAVRDAADDESGVLRPAAWAHQAHCGHGDFAGLSVSRSDGAVALLGSFAPTVDFDGPPLHASPLAAPYSTYLIVLDRTGDVRWERTIDSADELATPIWTPSGKLLVGGGFSGTFDGGAPTLTGGARNVDVDPFVAAYASDGTPLWAHDYHADAAGARSSVISAMVSDGEEGVIIAASVVGAVDFGNGRVENVAPDADAGATPHQAAIAKLDAIGNGVWTRPLEATSYVNVNRLAVSPDGTIAIAGTAEGDVDYGSGVEHGRGTFIAVLDAAGSFSWWRTFALASAPPVGGADVFGLAWMPDGTLVVVATAKGTVDFGDGPMTTDASVAITVIRARYAPDGTAVDVKTIAQGDIQIDGLRASVAFDSVGRQVLVWREPYPESSFGRTMVMTALDPSGERVWQTRIRSVVLGAVWVSVDLDGSGGILATGALPGPTTVDLGGSLVMSSKLGDAFVAKFLW